jgi:CRISPR/Cas system CMR-associated protein Cmr1 (group 7 of RAMP superfamily)
MPVLARPSHYRLSLSSERVHPHQNTRKCLTVINIRSQATDRQTSQLTVSRSKTSERGSIEISIVGSSYKATAGEDAGDLKYAAVQVIRSVNNSYDFDNFNY